MLQLTTKWFTNSLAKQAMLSNDFIECVNEQRLYVVGYGVLTTSGKNTYNVVLKDSDDKVVSEHANLYLDAITKLILGATPKSKANKESEANESKPKKQTNKTCAKESLLLTFNEAFKIACNEIESYKDVAKILGKYDTKDAIKLTLNILKEAKEKEAQRVKDSKKNEELNALRVSLEIAKQQGNTMLVDAILNMIANKEKE